MTLPIFLTVLTVGLLPLAALVYFWPAPPKFLTVKIDDK